MSVWKRLGKLAVWIGPTLLVGGLLACTPGALVSRWYELRGVFAAALGRPADAVADFTLAVEQDPGFTAAYLNRAVSFTDLGQYDSAVADYTTTAGMGPRPFFDTYLPYFQRGVVLSMKGDHHAAITDLTTAIENAAGLPDTGTPDRPYAYKNRPGIFDLYHQRGKEYLEVRQPDNAIADFTAAISWRPFQSGPYAYRALAYVQKGDHPRAIEDFTRAFELFPAAWVLAARGESYLHLGRNAEALEDFRNSLARETDPKERAATAKLIETMAR